MNNYSDEDVSATIVQAYCTGRAIHGGLGVRLEDFESNLIGILTKHLGAGESNLVTVNFIKGLHTNDLYLGHACARRNEVAWDRFSVIYGQYIKALANFVAVSNTAATDIADNVLVDLFLPRASGQSRIASYEGRSSLATWLRVVVMNHAINERERCGNKIGDLGLLDFADEAAPLRMDASLRACRYERIIQDALRCSCLCLTDHERLILLLRYRDGLHLGYIARLFGVHQSTITRQLERACKKLRQQVMMTLSSKHNLDPAAISECQEDILENPSYSVLDLLQPQSARK